jgi:hypothetical protein
VRICAGQRAVIWSFPSRDKTRIVRLASRVLRSEWTIRDVVSAIEARIL